MVTFPRTILTLPDFNQVSPADYGGFEYRFFRGMAPVENTQSNYFGF
jgi:hypothetical protein